MSARVSDAVAKRLASLFGSEVDADCTIIFCLEADAPAAEAAQKPLEADASAAEAVQKQSAESTADGQGEERLRHGDGASVVSSATGAQQHREGGASVESREDAQRAAKRQRVEGVGRAGAASDGLEGSSVLGDPLPAHQLILGSSSELFAAKIRRWDEGRATRLASERLVLRVPLGCEAEVPSARVAIQFAYTGDVAAGSVREALEVRRQAAYLGIEGCAAACDERISGMLLAQGEASEALREFYECSDLWPDAAEDPGLSALVTIADQRLVAHFGDALACLNSQLLLDQMLDLPAAALEALLGSDDFGTDTESTVLLVLSYWMKVNYDSTDADTRQRLCGHVRLVQLSRAYLTSVLPLLAAEHDAWVLYSSLDKEGPSPPETPARTGWFPVSAAEAAFIATLTTSSGEERYLLTAKAHGVRDMDSPWYCTQPRRQCLPEGGRVYSWHIDQKDLEEALDRVVSSGDQALVDAVDDASGFANYNARGFHLNPGLRLCVKDGAIKHYLSLACDTPDFIGDAETEMKKYGVKCSVIAATRIDARVTIHHWQDGIRGDDELHEWGVIAAGMCRTRALKKVRQPAAPAAGSRPLDALAAYLRDGKITGTITFLPQS